MRLTWVLGPILVTLIASCSGPAALEETSTESVTVESVDLQGDSGTHSCPPLRRDHR